VAESRRRTIAEVLIVYALATGAASLLYNVGQSVGFIHRQLHALVALVFLVLPQLVLRRRGNIERYGFTTQPLGLGLAIAAIAILLVLPLFAGGFVVAVRYACAHMPLWVPGSCFRATHPLWRVPADFPLQVAAQLVVIALPEELFFRGFLLELLERRFPPKRRWKGGGIGVALVMSSAMFALIHLPKEGYDPRQLATFFPGLLFGWMRSSTRSILASTVTHAGSNILVHVLDLMAH